MASLPTPSVGLPPVGLPRMVVTVPAGKGGQQHEQCFNGTSARVLGAGGTPMFLDVAPVTHRFLLEALPDDATDSLLAATAAQV